MSTPLEISLSTTKYSSKKSNFKHVSGGSFITSLTGSRPHLWKTKVLLSSLLGAAGFLFFNFHEARANAVFSPSSVTQGSAAVNVKISNLSPACVTLVNAQNADDPVIAFAFYEDQAAVGLSTPDHYTSCNGLKNGADYTDTFPHTGAWYLALSVDALDPDNSVCNETICTHGKISVGAESEPSGVLAERIREIRMQILRLQIRILELRIQVLLNQ